jgi:hypothetical protein
VPVPSDAKWTVTAPLTLPAAAVFRPTTMLLESLRPAPSRPTLPPKVIRGSSALPKLALSFSEKPSFGARLLIVSAWLTAVADVDVAEGDRGEGVRLGQAVGRAPAAKAKVTTWLRVLSKLLTIATDWPLSGASEPAAPTGHDHVAGERGARRERAPVAGGHAAARERGSVMLPPLTPVWTAPRRAGRCCRCWRCRTSRSCCRRGRCRWSASARRVAVDDARAGMP